MKQAYPLSSFLSEYSEKNDGNKYRPVAVGRYGIRTRESIYSKELAKDYSKNKLIHKNTLTVGMGSVQIDIGVLTDDITYSVSPAYHTYRVAGINAAYLRYCLECRNQDMFARFVKRGSRQGKTIDLTRWLTYEIPVYDAVMQAEIVDRLDRISALIEKRQEQLLQLDELVKSRFIELFGDPASNPKAWDTGRLGDYMTTLTDFSANGSYELLDSHVVMYDEPRYAIMVRTTDLEAGDLKNGVKYIDQDAYELLGKSKLYGGEMIMNKIGSAGKIYIMPHIKMPASLGRNAFMFRFDHRINMAFLYALLTSEYGTAEIQQHVRGAVTKTITKDSARSIRIIVPPLELQEQFAAFVEQTDKSKYYSSLSYHLCRQAASNYRQEWMTCRTSNS